MAPGWVDPVRLTQVRVELGPGFLLVWDLWLQTSVVGRLWGHWSGRRKHVEPVTVRRSCPVDQGVRLLVGRWATCVLAWGSGHIEHCGTRVLGPGRLIPAWTSMWSVANDDQCRGWSGGAGLLGGIRTPAPSHAYGGCRLNPKLRRAPLAHGGFCCLLDGEPVTRVDQCQKQRQCGGSQQRSPLLVVKQPFIQTGDQSQSKSLRH